MFLKVGLKTEKKEYPAANGVDQCFGWMITTFEGVILRFLLSL